MPRDAKKITRRIDRLITKAVELEMRGRNSDSVWKEISDLNEKLACVIENEAYLRAEFADA